MSEAMCELVRQSDHRALALWAADCAERVLPLFEARFPDDGRPRRAIDDLREFARTGRFRWRRSVVHRFQPTPPPARLTREVSLALRPARPVRR